MLGGHPKRQIGLNTDVIITFGECSDNKKYEFAKSYVIPIANLVKFIDLVESELHKNLAKVINESFLVFV